MSVEYQGEDLQPEVRQLFSGDTNVTAFACLTHDLLCAVCTPSRTRKQMWFFVLHRLNHVC